MTIETNAVEPAYEFKADRQELIVTRPKSAPVDSKLPLMVGDCIHNVRSALDRLVFQLAILNHASSKAATKTSFPICLTPSHFKNVTRDKVAPFISGSALTEIEKLQPYAAGNAGESDVICVLSQLDTIDKHRLLIVTQAKTRPVAFTLIVPTGEQFSKEIPHGEWKSAQAGAEIIRFDLSGAIRHPGKVQVTLSTSMTIQIENTGMICDGTVLLNVLSDCIQHASNVVGYFGHMFFGE